MQYRRPVMNVKIIALLLGGVCLFPIYSYSRSVTFYADGALFDVEGNANKGIVEIPLPSGVLENSLRIKPLGNAQIKNVEILAIKGDGGKKGKDYNSLLEQKSRLEDRLKALETREKIFTAAAKSQSGKAPRKSKANPDPMRSIRQGTDFAIAQLESVYMARRKAEQELKLVDERIADYKRNGSVSRSIARVLLASPKGSVIARYIVNSISWTPRYDLRVSGNNSVALDLLALVPNGFNGYKRYASFSNYADSFSSTPVVVSNSNALLARYNLAVSENFFGSIGQNKISFVIKNSEKQTLPAGDATVYRNGEYLGKARFETLSSGHSRKVVGGM